MEDQKGHRNVNVIFDMRPALLQLTFLMLGASLFIDAINGFFLSGLGIDPKLSAVFKLSLLGLVLCQIGMQSRIALFWSLLILILFLIGPVFNLTSTLNISGLIEDLTAALRILTTLYVFIYVCLVAEKFPDKVEEYGKLALKFGFLVLLCNIVLGVLGFGFSSYGNAAQDEEHAIGIKGFFYAGNEVSGVFVILYGAMLHLIWQRNKILYLLFSLLALITGLLIATKAAMIAAAVLIIAIPVANERERILNLTPLKLKLVAPIVITGIVMAIVLIPILDSTGLLNRFMWFYEKKGVIGIVLSGRDEFVFGMLIAFEQFATWSDIIFGVSQSGLGLYTKNAMEIDPIDLYLWHGVVGLIFFIVVTVVFLRVSYLATRISNSLWGPPVLIINVILIGVSIVAGHILTSGMLAPYLGLINGLAYIDLVRGRHAAENHNAYMEIE